MIISMMFSIFGSDINCQSTLIFWTVKTLRAILIAVYPILIALLLIAHLKACDSETPSSDTSEEAEPVETLVEEPDT